MVGHLGGVRPSTESKFASPPAIEELKKFEECMLNLVSNITFKQRPKGDDFQKQLAHDSKNTIKSSSDILIKADKTTNFYHMKPEKYTTALNENVTKTYKKIDNNVVTNIEKKSKIRIR